ncbi:MAG TPA: hypothetical protein VMU09_10635, partial [Acidimicrobiales bacterium]|nr:hypothetical protein [Acidimicrobiales bacterium]
LERGTSLLVVEQHVGRALELADHVVLLAHGRVAAAGPTADVAGSLSALLPSRALAAADAEREPPGGIGGPRPRSGQGPPEPGWEPRPD